MYLKLLVDAFVLLGFLVLYQRLFSIVVISGLLQILGENVVVPVVLSVLGGCGRWAMFSSSVDLVLHTDLPTNSQVLQGELFM